MARDRYTKQIYLQVVLVVVCRLFVLMEQMTLFKKQRLLMGPQEIQTLQCSWLVYLLLKVVIRQSFNTENQRVINPCTLFIELVILHGILTYMVKQPKHLLEQRAQVRNTLCAVFMIAPQMIERHIKTVNYKILTIGLLTLEMPNMILVHLYLRACMLIGI